MNYTEAIVLGITQGLTEFLPVSSSGHLKLGHLLFNTEGCNRAFNILVHGATLVVIIVAFWPRFVSIIREQPRDLGILALASVGPIITVLTVGFIVTRTNAETPARTALEERV